MSMYLLPYTLFDEVAALQPKPTAIDDAEPIVTGCLKAMEVEMRQAAGNPGLDGVRYWSMYLPAIDGATPKKVGVVLRWLGLLLKRANAGYRVYWTEEQWEILAGHFLVKVGG